MASTMMHYAMASRIAEQLPAQVDRDRFLTGAAIGPDACSHEDGTYNLAHFTYEYPQIGKKGIEWSLFEKKYGEKLFQDAFYLGYWCHLIQDAVWVREMYGKYVRIYPGEIRRRYLQTGYRDYDRYNYLLRQEFHLTKPAAVEMPAIDEMSADLYREMQKELASYFEVKPCEKEELELYRWDSVMSYLQMGVELCLQEYAAMRTNGERVLAEQFYMPIRK